MSDSDIEWVPGIPRRERALNVCAWVSLALIAGDLAMLIPFRQGAILVPRLAFFGLTFAMIGMVLVFSSLMYLTGRRPGFLEIGVSESGLSIRYPLLLTRSFSWSDLIWYPDRMRVEGKSGWDGPSLLSLTPTQFHRIQRELHPR